MPSWIRLSERRRRGVELLCMGAILYLLSFDVKETTALYGNVLPKVPYWHNPHCNKLEIERNIIRVCQVKRNAAYLILRQGTAGSFGDYDLASLPLYSEPLDFPPPTQFGILPPFFFYPLAGRPFFNDPFKRWRRQATINDIIIKCCSSGCSPTDYDEVDSMYNFCDK